jgi:hypothetical protein
MPKAFEPGQFSMVPKFSTTSFHSSLAIVLNKPMSKLCCNFSIPTFKCMYIKIMLWHKYVSSTFFNTNPLRLPSKPCKQSIAKCPLKFTFQNIEKKNSKNKELAYRTYFKYVK